MCASEQAPKAPACICVGVCVYMFASGASTQSSCVYVCMYVCMYVCKYVCTHTHVCVCAIGASDVFAAIYIYI